MRPVATRSGFDDKAVSQRRGFIGGAFVRAPLWVLAAAILWGTTGTTLALAPPETDPLVLGALRLALSGPLLLATSQFSRAQLLSAWRSVAVASLAVAAYQLTFFLGVRANGVAIGTLIAIGSAPLLAAALEMLTERRPPSLRWLFATVLALLGLGLLLHPGGTLPPTPTGTLASLAAGASYAFFVFATRRAVRAGLAARQVIACSFVAAAALLIPLLFWRPVGWLSAPGGLLAALYLGIVATALSYRLFARGVAGTSAATLATLSLAEPLTATLLAVFVIGEDLTSQQRIGVTSLVAGLGLAALGEQMHQRGASTTPFDPVREERA
jgi:DME family drug/metabolite transporter